MKLIVAGGRMSWGGAVFKRDHNMELIETIHAPYVHCNRADDVITLDLSRPMTPHVLADAQYMPFADGSFTDVTIECIPCCALCGDSGRRIFSECRRVLVPGGNLYGETGLCEPLTETFAKLCGWNIRIVREEDGGVSFGGIRTSDQAEG